MCPGKGVAHLSGPALSPLGADPNDNPDVQALRKKNSARLPPVKLAPYRVQPTSDVQMRQRVAGVTAMGELGEPSTNIEDRRGFGAVDQLGVTVKMMQDYWQHKLGL